MSTPASTRPRTRASPGSPRQKGDFKSYNLIISLELTLVRVVDLKNDVNVIFRPYITEFLEAAAVYYNVTVVTVISRSIAEKIIAHVDPSGRLVKKKITLKPFLGETRKLTLEDPLFGTIDRTHSLFVRNSQDLCLQESDCEIVIPPWDNSEIDETLKELSEKLKDIAVSRIDNIRAHLCKIRNSGIKTAADALGSSNHYQHM